ncbi:MAG: RidA family protein [Deltaproteobacteria bacterium]|nr:RidA family protein [Candidatus Zymogenaceae bacterium]
MNPPKKTNYNNANNRKVLVNPQGSEAIYNAMGFSQAVRAGNTVWISGQVGIDKDFKIGEGIEEQARRAFENLSRVIREAGGSLDDIVELVTYHTSMTDMKAFSKVKAEFIRENFPAWTAVGVRELVMPGLLVEIRATAVIGSNIY